MAYVDKSFSNASGNGSDFTICTLNGLPSIPAGAILDSLVLSFNAYRSGGGSNAEVFVTCAGHKLRLQEDFPKKQTISLSINFCDTYGMNLVNNNNGVLSFTDGSTSVGIRGYHDYWLFGASDWTISSINIRANYTIPTYTISTAVSPTGSGTVTGGGTYENGATVTLKATPNVGYYFDRWDEDDVTTPEREVTVTGDATYTAIFNKASYFISVSASPGGSGTVTGGGMYGHGESVILTAIPADGYKFVKWEDGNTDNPRTIIVDGIKTFIAIMEAAPPEILSAQLLYSDKQVSQSNKVKAGEGFRIIIDVQ